jgi:hypothetical protein
MRAEDRGGLAVWWARKRLQGRRYLRRRTWVHRYFVSEAAAGDVGQRCCARENLDGHPRKQVCHRLITSPSWQRKARRDKLLEWPCPWRPPTDGSDLAPILANHRLATVSLSFVFNHNVTIVLRRNARVSSTQLLGLGAIAAEASEPSAMAPPQARSRHGTTPRRQRRTTIWLASDPDF